MRKTSREQISSRERQLIHGRRRAERKREIEDLQLHEQQALRLHHDVRQQVCDLEFHTRAVLDEQRSGMINQAKFELNVQERQLRGNTLGSNVRSYPISKSGLRIFTTRRAPASSSQNYEAENKLTKLLLPVRLKNGRAQERSLF